MHLKLVHAQEEEKNIKRYRIAFPPELILAGSQGTKVAEAGLDVTWDERYTTLQQALLVFSAHGRNDGWPAFPRSVEARLYVNDFLVGTRGWPGYWAACATQTIDANVGAYFISGRNRFRLEVVGSWGPLAAGIDGISGDLELQFLGKEPTVKPPPPEWFEYVKWPLVGLGVVAALFIGLKVFEAVKRS